MKHFKKIIAILAFAGLFSCGNKQGNKEYPVEQQGTNDKKEVVTEPLQGLDREKINDKTEKGSPDLEAITKMLQENDMFSQEQIDNILSASNTDKDKLAKLLEQVTAGESGSEKSSQAMENFFSNFKEDQGNSNNTEGGSGLFDKIKEEYEKTGEKRRLAPSKYILQKPWGMFVEEFEAYIKGTPPSRAFLENNVKGSPYSQEENAFILQLDKRIRPFSSTRFIENEAMYIKSIDLEELKAQENISDKFVKKIKDIQRSTRLFSNDFLKRAKIAKSKFQKENPSLYFSDAASATYFSEQRDAVFLPLGKLSFADKVVQAHHPSNTGNPDKLLNEVDGYLVMGASKLPNNYSLGKKGSVIVKFTDNALVNVNGPDLYIFEMGAIEPTKLEISKNGKDWVDVGKIDGGTAMVDIEKFVEDGELYYYIRLTDLDTYSTIPGADIDAIASIGSAIRLQVDSKVLFDTGKSELKEGGKEAIEALITSINQIEKGSIIIEGHTDNVGSEASNIALSKARADRVAAVLKNKLGTNNFTFKQNGLGEGKPVAPNDTEESKAKNRRVEILVLPH